MPNPSVPEHLQYKRNNPFTKNHLCIPKSLLVFQQICWGSRRFVRNSDASLVLRSSLQREERRKLLSTNNISTKPFSLIHL